MSITALNWAFRLHLPSSQKAVLIALADHASNEDASCYPSNARIQLWTGLSERTVRSALRALQTAKLISKDVGHSGHENPFFVQIGNGVKPAAVAAHEPADTAEISANVAPLPANIAQKTATVAPKPLEPPLNHKIVLRTNANRVEKQPDARDRLWSVGLASLQAMTGLPGPRARGLLGKLVRDAKDDCALVQAVLLEAEEHRPLDPFPWLRAAIQARAEGREGLLEQLGREMDFSIDTIPRASDFDGEGKWINGHSGSARDGNLLAHDA